MGRKRKAIRLSAGEMELMSLLWHEGPVTLAEAHKAFGRYGRPIGYPTTQTRLNRLVEKSLATRNGDRPAKYRAAVSPEDVAAGHLDQLLDKLACTSVAPLVSHLISERPLSPEEIDELTKLLATAEKSAKRAEGRRTTGD